MIRKYTQVSRRKDNGVCNLLSEKEHVDMHVQAHKWRER